MLLLSHDKKMIVMRPCDKKMIVMRPIIPPQCRCVSSNRWRLVPNRSVGSNRWRLWRLVPIVVHVAMLCIVLIYLIAVAMPKRSRNDDGAIVASLDTNGSVTAFLKSFRSNCRPSQLAHDTERKIAGRLVYTIPETHTPFGTVCTSTEVRGKKDSVTVYHVNPQAMFYLALEDRPIYQDFLLMCRDRAPGNILRLGIYLDGCRPGNVLRPDLGRSR